ncbi:MAG: hypothetical protein QM831_11270 [Kofleriaceae bacterium]
MRSWVLALVAACRFSPGATSDGGPNADAAMIDAIDSGTPRNTCLNEWMHPETLAFTQRRALAELNSTDAERDPSLSADELQIWFTTRRTTTNVYNYQIWTALRSSTADTFGPITVDTQASGTLVDTYRRYQNTNNTAYVIASNRVDTNGFTDIWLSTRVDGQFTTPSNEKLSNVDTAFNQYDPWISDDLKELVYASVDSGVEQIWRATRTDDDGDFDEPVRQVDLDLGGLSADPTLFANDQVIVFSSINASNVGGAVNSDLWYALANGDNHWSTANQLPVNTVNTADAEGDPWVSPDGCHMYFAAHVDMRDLDLFEADVIVH